MTGKTYFKLLFCLFKLLRIINIKYSVNIFKCNPQCDSFIWIKHTQCTLSFAACLIVTMTADGLRTNALLIDKLQFALNWSNYKAVFLLRIRTIPYDNRTKKNIIRYYYDVYYSYRLVICPLLINMAYNIQNVCDGSYHCCRQHVDSICMVIVRSIHHRVRDHNRNIRTWT